MASFANTSHVSELLKSAGIINSTDLANATQVASKTGLPIGRILVMLGFATNEMVNAAMEAENLLKERSIAIDMARKAMAMVAASRVSFGEALAFLSGRSDERVGEKSDLGDLLLTAEIIDGRQLHEAIATSQHLGLPLGRIFVLKGILSKETVEATLNVQILLRDGMISRRQGIEALVIAHENQCPLEAAIVEMGLPLAGRIRAARLGEMLVMAAVVTETDMLTALEVSLLNEQPIGQVMLSLGFISEDILAAGLTLQATLGHESLSLGEAVGALERIHSDHLTLIQAVCEAYSLEAGEIDDAALLALLVESGLVEPAAAERTLAVSLHVRQSFVDLLIRNELIDEELLCEAIKCQLLLKENLIPQAIAVPALRHCQWTGIDLATIIHQLETDEPGEEACEPHISEQSARRPGSPGGDGQFAPMIDADVMTLQHSWH